VYGRESGLADPGPLAGVRGAQNQLGSAQGPSAGGLFLGILGGVTRSPADAGSGGIEKVQSLPVKNFPLLGIQSQNGEKRESGRLSPQEIEEDCRALFSKREVA